MSDDPEIKSQECPWPLDEKEVAQRLARLQEEDPALWAMCQDARLRPLLERLSSIPNRLRAAEQVRALLKVSGGNDMFSEFSDRLLRRVGVRDSHGYCLL